MIVVWRVLVIGGVGRRSDDDSSCILCLRSILFSCNCSFIVSTISSLTRALSLYLQQLQFKVSNEKSGRYPASHPSWFRKQRQLQATRSYPSDIRVIADTASSFRPESLFQPYPAALPNSQAATIQQKLDELRILAAKLSFPQDARKILGWVNIRLRNGDEGFLNNKLDQLRMLDRQGWLPI